MKTRVWCGLDRIEKADSILRKGRVGLMTNPCGISHDFVSTVDIVKRRYQLSALFACEHGIRGDAQAGADIETYIDEETGVPVFSVYGATNRMTEEMIDSFDVFLYDLQCVGVRFYTFLYSLAYAMEACAKAGKPVVVLDRLNPISAVQASGTVLDPAFRSFVGDYEMPSQHGLTMGEYALYVKDYLQLDLDLTVVTMEGYRRTLYLDDTDTPWVAPSPNCQALHTALCYVGTCVFEGTNFSEGRGTTLPFELIGAPWIDAAALERRMTAYDVPGIHFRRASFLPVYHKHQGEVCYGVQMHVTDRTVMQPFLGAMLLLDAMREQAPDKFAFRSSMEGRYKIDMLLGTDEYRKGLSAAALVEKHRPLVDRFVEKTKAFRLYE